jgi:tetratricopeptide (TPR) repeat protein
MPKGALAGLGVAAALVVGCGAHVSTPATMPRSVEGAPAARAAFALPEAAATSPASPVSLTASDGTGLALESLRARATLRGPLVETELTLTFANPADRLLEGRFRIALPPRAFTSRLAMKVDGRWTEADVAEIPAARAVYEEILHQRRDPLLVEQREDNELQARVFPIRPREKKEIVVGWIAEVSADNPVTVPLRGLPRVERLDVSVVDGATEPLEVHEQDVQPREDVRFVPRYGASALRAKGSVVARVRVPGESAPEPIGRAMVVLLDTSASRAAEVEGDLRLVRAVAGLLAKTEPDARVAVGAFDQDTELLFEGSPRDLAGAGGEAAAVRLRARGALGASDLERALGWAAREAARLGATRVLLVGDGIATAGSSDRARLRETARRLADAGVERFDVLAVSDVRDEGTLRALATGAGRHEGVVVDASAIPAAADVAARLTKKTRARVPVEVRGATWSWPSAFDGVQEGDERLVYAEVPAGAPAAIVVDGRDAKLAIEDAPAGVVERVTAKARIDALTAAGITDASREEVVALSKKHRVTSTLTAFIVLESDVDRAMLRVAGKPLPPPRPVAATPAPPRDGLLTPPPPIAPARPSHVAVGSGRGRVPGAHVAKAVSLRIAEVTVTGRLLPDAIQLVVRRNFGRFRACYEQGLRGNRKLEGRVVTKFVIGRDGAVSESIDAGSELPDTKVVACIVQAFRELTFAPPVGGIATVTYPLVLHPEPRPDDVGERVQMRAPAPVRRRSDAVASEPLPPPWPWRGPFGDVIEHLARFDARGALDGAAAAHAADARDVVALLALGEALEAADMREPAARAYGSIADLQPHRAEMLRLAGARLRRLGPAARPLAIELLRRARDDRPDQPSSHHLLAMALLEAGDHERAFDALAEGLGRSYAPRYGASREVLVDDLRLVAAAWSAAEPVRSRAIDARAFALGASRDPDERPSARFVSTWETDASHVQLTVAGSGESAWVSYASDGFGPQSFVVRASPRDAEATPFSVKVTLHRRGPAGGDVPGVVDVLTHDGRGHVSVEPRPFVIMTDGASVDLGELRLLSPSSGSRARSPSSRGG